MSVIVSENKDRQTSIAISQSSRQTTALSSMDEEQRSAVFRETIVFPLFSEGSRVVTLNSLVVSVQLLVLGFQLVFSAMIFGSTRIWAEYGPRPLLPLFKVCDIGVFNLAWSDTHTYYIVMGCISIFSMLYFLYALSQYQMTRSFTKVQLYVFQYYSLVLAPVLSCIDSYLLSRALYEMSLDSNNSNVPISIVFIFIVIYNAVLAHYANEFAVQTPVISRALNGSWDADVLNFLYMYLCVSGLFSRVSDLFPKWISFLMSIIAIAFVIFEVYYISFLPMLHQGTNTFLFSFACAAAGSVIVGMVKMFYFNIKPMFTLGVSLTCLFTGTFVFKYFSKKKIERIKKLLSIETIGEDGTVTDAMKREHFDSFLFTSSKDAICYLHVGVMHQCDLFLDFSFMRYLVENYGEQDILFAVAHMASFFPTELQFYSYSLNILNKCTILSVPKQYMLFQMKRIHVLRQSSVSREAASDVSKLQKESQSAIGSIRGFWLEIVNSKNDISFASLIYLRISAKRVDSLFLDATDRFSNNQNICNEYSRFLIEGEGDFNNAILWRRKALMIEQGKQLSVDHAFRALVNVYPDYLYKHILDTRGAFVNKNVSMSSSSLSVSSDTSSSDQFGFEQRYEEIIQTMFPQGKLRLALQSAVQSAKFPAVSSSYLLSWMQFIVSCAVFLIILFLLPNVTDEARAMLNENRDVSLAINNMQYIAFVGSVKYAELPSINKFSGVQAVLNFTNMPIQFLENVSNAIYQSEIIVKESAASIVTLMTNVVKSFMQDPSKRTEAISALVNTTAYFTLFNSTSMTSVIPTTPKGFMWFFSDYAIETASMTFNSSLVNESILKERITTLTFNPVTTSTQLMNLYQVMNDAGHEASTVQETVIKAVAFGFAAVFFSVFFILQVIFVIRVFKEMSSVSTMLRKVGIDVAEQSMKPISLQDKEDRIPSGTVQSAHVTDFTRIFFPMVSVLSAIATAALISATGIALTTDAATSKRLFNWFYDSTIRTMSLSNAITLVPPVICGAYSPAEIVPLLAQHIQNMSDAHERLIVDAIGFSSILDAAQLDSQCFPEELPISKMSAYIHCLSIDRKVNMMYQYLTRIIQRIANISSLEDTDYLTAAYIYDAVLFTSFKDYSDKLFTACNEHFASMEQTIKLICGAGMGVALLFFILSSLINGSFSLSLQAVQQLICVLPPSSVVRNTLLMNFIIGAETSENEVIMSPAESVIFASSNAAILLNTEDIIEVVNPSLQRITGFTPDQVLGQPISWLISKPGGSVSSSSSSDDDISSAHFYQKMTQMRTNASDNVAVVNVRCNRDSGGYVVVKATIFASRNEQGILDSFVVLLRDMSQEMDQKRLVHEAKRRTDTILDSIIPPQVLNAIKQENASTLFMSETAVVIFIEITGFVEQVHTMSPKQLMSTLSSIYDKFEEITRRWPAVHSLKTNDDLFVCCSGLFDFKDDLVAQSEQSVRFCLELNQSIDDINEQLSLNIGLKFGVNMGGPLVGSVLNPLTPTFDILGGLIGLAVKMQCDGTAGVVQISESIVKHLDKNRFDIEKGPTLTGARGKADQVFYVKGYHEN